MSVVFHVWVADVVMDDDHFLLVFFCFDDFVSRLSWFAIGDLCFAYCAYAFCWECRVKFPLVGRSACLVLRLWEIPSLSSESVADPRFKFPIIGEPIVEFPACGRSPC